MERANKHWTEEEKNFVYDVWGDMPVKKIAKELGRTFNSIVRFAERNNLGGAMLNDMFLSTTEASEIISVDPTTIISWINTNQLKAKRRTMRKRKVYLIDPDDFRKFLRTNQDKWNASKLQDGFFDENQADWLVLKKERDSNPVTKKSNSLWTIKEQNTLIDLAKRGFTNREIATKLDRTLASVQRKRDRLRKLGECI